MTVLRLDKETRSAIDLTAMGVHLYAKHPSTAIWLLAWCFDDDEPVLWHPGEPCPPPVAEFVTKRGGPIRIWNAQFERIMWREILGPRHSWPIPALDQYQCTMARAYALSLPGGLDACANAVGLSRGKDQAGYRLMMQMCRPRRIETDLLGQPRYVWWDEPEKIQKLGEYCKQDVRVEREIDKRLLALRPSEEEVYRLDQKINDRGVFIDRPLCRQAIKVIAGAQKRLDHAIGEVTGWAVTSCSNHTRLAEWLRGRGVDTASVDKASIDELLVRDDLPDDVERALHLRKEGSKTSVAKVQVMLDRSAVDGWMRGNLQYHGAGTGRWAARGKAQLQNLPRPELVKDDDEDVAARLQAEAIETLMTGDDSLVEIMHGPALTVVSDCIRGMVVAPPNHQAYVADFAQIEARDTGWLGGQDDMLAVFRSGKDIYCHNASGIFARPIEKKQKFERSVGKVSTLALGFGGGVGAFHKMAKTYRVDMSVAYGPLREVAGQEVHDKAVEAYESHKDHLGMPREAWLASEMTKIVWRKANPNVVGFWHALEDAAIAAVENPGLIVPANDKITYRMAGSFLFCRLPSGRSIAYPYPKITMKEMPWSTREKPAWKKQLVFKGVHPITKQWTEIGAWYGLLCENCLSGDTEVLTDSGWKLLADVESCERLWDGLEWVSHSGLTCKGVRRTGALWGVRMTPDHEVLTTEGWRNAAAASEGHDRAPVRLPDGFGVCPDERKERDLAGSLRLRRREGSCRGRTEARPCSQLRVHAEEAAVRTAADARDVADQDLCGLAFNGGSLHAADASSLAELRREGDNGLRRVAGEFCQVRCRHGADLSGRFAAGSDRQREGVFQRKLPLDGPGDAGPEQTGQPHDRHAEGTDVGRRGIRSEWYWRDDAPVSGGSRLPHQPSFYAAGLYEPVFDVVNAGPRHRFTVRGADGVPFLVHNCVQATARDMMAEAMLRVERAGYRTVITIHDEVVCYAPKGFGSVEEFVRIMEQPPAWAAGCPIKAEGYTAKRYRK